MSDTSGQEQRKTDSAKRGFVTRRTIVATTAGSLGLGIGGVAFIHTGTQPALAAEGTSEFVANSASVTAPDGSVSAVEFGDPGGDDHEDLDDGSDRLVLSWEGINDPENDDPDFTLEVRGADDPEDEDADPFDDGEDNYQEILSIMDAVTITSTNGSEAYSWREIFGEDTADVLEHPQLETGDFEADDDGEVRVRELQVKIRVEWDAEPGVTVTAEKEARGTITVTNEGAAIEIGGRGSFNVESDE